MHKILTDFIDKIAREGISVLVVSLNDLLAASPDYFAPYCRDAQRYGAGLAFQRLKEEGFDAKIYGLDEMQMTGVRPDVDRWTIRWLAPKEEE